MFGLGLLCTFFSQIKAILGWKDIHETQETKKSSEARETQEVSIFLRSIPRIMRARNNCCGVGGVGISHLV